MAVAAKPVELDSSYLAILVRLWEQPGYPPSIRELCGMLGISPKAILDRLARLRQLGLVDWADSTRMARTLRATCTVEVIQ